MQNKQSEILEQIGMLSMDLKEALDASYHHESEKQKYESEVWKLRNRIDDLWRNLAHSISEHTDDPNWTKRKEQ